MSGISGVDVDFDDLIDKLYDIESTQANKLIEWREDWQIRREAFTQVREALVSMQTALTAINTTDKFLVKTAASSDSSTVTATASSDAVAGTTSVEVNQLAGNAVWSIDTGFAAKTDVVNDSGSEGSFTYTYKGESRTVKVPAKTTLEGLKNIINNDSENLGVRVQIVQSGDSMIFQLSGLDTGLSASLSVDETTNLTGLEVEKEATWGISGTNTLVSYTAHDSYTEAINTTATAKTFSFAINGETYTVKLAAGGSLTDLCTAVNATTAESGVTAQIAAYDNSDGETVYSLHLSTEDSADVLTVEEGTLAGYSGMTAVTNWDTQQGQNAEIRVNGWPKTGWLEKESNTVTDVVDGLTLSLRSEGKATVTVELDSSAIEENVQTFVDAVNSFRSLILTLTKVDDSKTVLDPEYAETQSEMQMGSALTGNYGIQLISSNLKQAVSGQAKGFSYLTDVEGKTYGDLFSSLAQIGIITDTEESSETFGLLVINTQKTDSSGANVLQSAATMTFAEALAQDPEAVAKLFASNSEGKSNSPNFGLNSHVVSVTEPGTYDVSYSTDADGNIVSAYINGKAATINMENSQIALYSHDGTDDAAGIVLDIYNFTPNSTMEGTVSIRQGKVNEILNMLSGTNGILGSNGSLSHLEDNYDEIIANIEAKIQKEDTRLQKWLTNTKLRFSRLETTLSTYQNLQTSIESQIEQLSSSSS